MHISSLQEISDNLFHFRMVLIQFRTLLIISDLIEQAIGDDFLDSDPVLLFHLNHFFYQVFSLLRHYGLWVLVKL